MIRDLRSGERYRKSAKWKRKLDQYRVLNREILYHGSDILNSANFDSTKQYLQHGSISVQAHSVNVARHSLILNKKLKINCNERELVRGALLHDYFLYDWHIPDEENPHRLHGFHHPERALENASREYDLSEREKEIIKKHMWPLTMVPPTCREAWIVSMADKWVSLMETIHVYKGHGVVKDSGEE